MPLHNQVLTGTLGKVDSIIVKITRYLSYLSAVCVCVIMCIAFFNVLGEKLLTTGIPATKEIIQYTHVPLVFLTVGYVTLDRGHTSIDLLSSHFPNIVQKFCKILGFLLGTGITAFMGCRGIVQMGKYMNTHAKSSLTGFGFPLWPFALIYSIGLFILAFTFAWSIVRLLAPKTDLEPEVSDSAAEGTAPEGGEA